MMVKREKWDGETVICIASGPSLSFEDCDMAQSSGLKTIVCNNSFLMAPWADILFGFDAKWWDEYEAIVSQYFYGRRMSFSNQALKYGVESLYNEMWFQNFSNSGACAAGLAIAFGAKRVLLLGYDCQKTGGLTHWHGDHPAKMSKPESARRWPEGMSNAATMSKWPSQFENLLTYANMNRAEIINCSRATALTMFDRMPIEQAFGGDRYARAA